MRGFRDLRIWQEAHELSVEIYRLTQKFPREEKFDLTSQIRSSANSVAAQIAEAHGRYYYADKVRVLYQARGEAEETRSHLSLSIKLLYINKPEFEKYDIRYENLSIKINAYIISLKKTVNKSQIN